MGRPDYIFGQFAQHGDGVCCALAPQLVLLFYCIILCTTCFVSTVHHLCHAAVAALVTIWSDLLLINLT